MITEGNTNPEDSNDNPSGNDEPKTPDNVSYESHQKLLSEKKATASKLKASQDELAALRADNAAATQKDLEDKEEWKKAYGLKTEELTVANEKIATQETERNNAKKLNSFFKILGSRVDEKYWNLIDIDKISIEDGQINEFSVSKYVDEFKGSFPEVVDVKDTRRMPNDQTKADSGSGTLSYAEWKKLPAKEMEARMHEVDKN